MCSELESANDPSSEEMWVQIPLLSSVESVV